MNAAFDPIVTGDVCAGAGRLTAHIRQYVRPVTFSSKVGGTWLSMFREGHRLATGMRTLAVVGIEAS
jgi:hypothetical protein